MAKAVPVTSAGAAGVEASGIAASGLAFEADVFGEPAAEPQLHSVNPRRVLIVNALGAAASECGQRPLVTRQRHAILKEQERLSQSFRREVSDAGEITSDATHAHLN